MQKMFLILSLVMASISTNAFCSETIELIPYNDARLNMRSLELSKRELKTDHVQNLIDQMLVKSGHEADMTRPDKKERLVGLAAPQVGWMKRVVIIDTALIDTANKMNTVASFDILINPKIVSKSEETNRYIENCYSVPQQITGMVSRANKIVVEALDREGNKVRKEYSDYTARVAQHEIDHLDGKRFPSRVDNEEDLYLVDWETELTDFKNVFLKGKPWDKHLTKEEMENLHKGIY